VCVCVCFCAVVIDLHAGRENCCCCCNVPALEPSEGISRSGSVENSNASSSRQSCSELALAADVGLVGGMTTIEEGFVSISHHFAQHLADTAYLTTFLSNNG
jgi:hypothetical protein